MRFSVFTAITSQWSPEETIDRLASAGWDGIEWAVKMDDSEDGYSLKWSRAVREGSAIAELTRRAGLEVVGVNFDELHPDTPDERVKSAIDVAASFGAPQMRFRVPFYGFTREAAMASDYNKLYEQTVERLGQAVRSAANSGLRLLIECHFGMISASASLALRIAERFSPTEVGVILDPGNQGIEGFENWKLEIELLGDYLAHVHAKNVQWGPRPEGNSTHPGLGRDWTWRWVPLEQGVVDWEYVVQALRVSGYDGWISLEDFSDAQASDKLVQVAYLRRLAST